MMTLLTATAVCDRTFCCTYLTLTLTLTLIGKPTVVRRGFIEA